MWSDNETEIDLLGFDFLVDELVVALTEPRLLPLTLGIAGGWGSGKSSLMRMTARELERFEGRHYVCVPFSPWQYEDYGDVKAALMTTVLAALRPLAKEADREDELTALQATASGLARFTRRFGRGGLKAAPILITTMATAHGLPAEAAPVLTAGLNEVAQAAGDALAEPSRVVETSLDGDLDIAAFRGLFGDLVGSLDAVDAVVVFVDDLDRCLPDTIVDTFEAIRLFLNAPKTAFAIALNRRVVEDAINREYPEIAGPTDTIGHDYLEKMLQLTVTVPSLSEMDAEAYVNLLLCEVGLDPKAFNAVREVAAERRRRGELADVMNYGIARETVTDIPSELERMFAWVNETIGVLTRGLRGNPRLLKRFLNTLELRLRASSRRGTVLERPVLAKLMVLEELWISHFERLYRWHLDGPSGLAPQLRSAETLARGEVAEDAKVDEEVAHWLGEEAIADWLRMEPPLAQIDLRPYFTFARDRLSPASPAARLPAHLQELLGRCQSGTAPVRNKAVEEAAALKDSENGPFWDGLADLARRSPGSPTVLSAIDLAARKPTLVSRLQLLLASIPPDAVSALVPLHLQQRFDPMPDELSSLLAAWAGSGNTALISAVTRAEQARTRGRTRDRGR